jgi:two-component system response regulator DesR
VTLPGELATGRELLRAAGIDAQLPTATDVVAPEYRELFGWAVREGLTNVVRHARATRCAIELGWTHVEISDDGIGSSAPAGNALAGVRERVEAGGGTVKAGTLAAAAALSHELPHCKTLILTTFGRAGYLRRAMEAGALGFVVKDAPAEQLSDAVRRVAAGERVVDPALAAATLASGSSPLTGRERDVLVAARDGATVGDIAEKLFLSEGTVRNYLSAAIAKVGVRNRMEAVRVADERGWL